MKQNILNEAKRIEEDSLNAVLEHYSVANRYDRIHWYIGVPAMVLAIIAGSMSLSPFENFHMIGGIVAIIAAGFASAMLFIHPNEQANFHRYAGNRFNALRNSVRFFYEVEAESLTSDVELTHRIGELPAMRDELNLVSPATPYQTLRQAKKNYPDKEITDMRNSIAEPVT